MVKAETIVDVQTTFQEMFLVKRYKMCHKSCTSVQHLSYESRAWQTTITVVLKLEVTVSHGSRLEHYQQRRVKECT